MALSFLTIGFQTAINAAAGALRMPWWRYLPGVVVGALFWAAIYPTIGFAVLEACLGNHPWPWVAGAAVAVAVVYVVTLVGRRRRGGRTGWGSRADRGRRGERTGSRGRVGEPR